MTTLVWEIPSYWGTMNLGEIAPEDASQILPSDYPETYFNYWGLDAIGKGQFEEPAPNPVRGAEIQSVCVRFNSSHVLYAKLRPYLNKVIVPSVEGIGSTEWLVLKPNPELLNRKYLAYVLRSEKFVEYASSNIAGARMPRARKSALWEASIPIPCPDDPARSLAEQRRIVARLEAGLSEVREMRALVEKMQRYLDALMEAALAEVFPSPGQALPDGWGWKTFPEICQINPKRPRLERHDEDLTSFVPMQAIDEQSGTIADMQIRPYSEVKRGYTYFEENDVLMAKITPSMENGKAAIARNLIDGIGFGTTEFHVFHPNSEILPEWMFHFIRRRTFREKARMSFRGAVGQQRVPEDFFYNQEIPIPYPDDPARSLAEQRRIVTRLEGIQEEVRAGRELLAQNEAHIAQLEQAILAMAFRGEL